MLACTLNNDRSKDELVLSTHAYVPLLPGTRMIYKTRGSIRSCVGFRGYLGGLDAIDVMPDSDRASTGCETVGMWFERTEA